MTTREDVSAPTETEISNGMALAKVMVGLVGTQRPAVQLAAIKVAAEIICGSAARRFGMSAAETLRYLAHMLTGGQKMTPDEYAAAANISFEGRATAIVTVNPAWETPLGATVHSAGDREAATLLIRHLRTLALSMELSLASEKKPAQA